VTEDPTTPTGPKLTITAPTTGHGDVVKDGQDVTVSYDVTGVTLAPAGGCTGRPSCGHVVAFVDGTKCNTGMATNFWSGVDMSFTVNFTNCTTPFWGPHQITLEVVTDEGKATILDSRRAPASDHTIVTAVPTYDVSLQKILSSKCAPCHTTAGSGGHNLAAVYDDYKKDLVVPMGDTEEATKAFAAEFKPCTDNGAKTVGSCAPLLVKSGAMPKGAGCTGDPSKDTANPACLTAAEQRALSVWASNGFPKM
jgi:hypothetical protein